MLPSQDVRQNRPHLSAGRRDRLRLLASRPLPELKIHWAGLIVLVCYLLAGLLEGLS